MANLLYCINGIVVGTHDSSQNVLPLLYGPATYVIPLSRTVQISYPPAPSTKIVPSIIGASISPLSDPSDLIAYAKTKQSLLFAGGIHVDVGEPIGRIEASTDSTNLSMLQGAYTLAQEGFGSFNWVQNTGLPVVLNSNQIIIIFRTLSIFMQNTFTTLAAAITEINAGRITSQSEIDILPWPTNN